MSFQIRHADPSDAEKLARLADAVSAEPEGWLISVGGEWRSAGDERRFLKALRRYAHAAVYVAERDDGALVGRLSVGRDPHPASAHVADVGLMVALDARRQGVGHGAPAGSGRLGAGRGRPQARAARLPVERGRDRPLRPVRLRARGLPQGALPPGRRVRRRDPDGLRGGVGELDRDAAGERLEHDAVTLGQLEQLVECLL